jgi:hypothetical protein
MTFSMKKEIKAKEAQFFKQLKIAIEKSNDMVKPCLS